MSTPTPSTLVCTETIARPPLRLRLLTPAGPAHLDGGWWPRSRDLALEVADLVAHFPAHLGGITRVLCSPPDWDDVVPGVQVHGRLVQTGLCPHDDRFHVDLETTDHTTLRLLVVPPSFDDADGQEALLAASTPGNAYSAGDVLAAVIDADHVDPSGLWRHDGTAGWASA